MNFICVPERVFDQLIGDLGTRCRPKTEPGCDPPSAVAASARKESDR
jgi:hypothetical protein